MVFSMEYKFTSDWFSKKIPGWEHIKNEKWDGDDKLTVIEIGSYEGRSSCWILNNLFQNPDSKIYCIDTFEGSMEHSEEQVDALYDRFIHNINCTKKDNQVEVLKGSSEDILIDLINKKVKADLIYIDGSHIAKDVLTDAVLSWKLLKNEGVMIFDDYLFCMYSDINMLPKFAIDSFVNIFFSEIKIISNVSNSQFYITKKSK